MALRALTALVVIGGIAVVFVIVFHDSLIRAWAETNPSVRHLLHTQGLEAVKHGVVRPPHLVAPAITFFVVIAGLLWVMAMFLRNGFEWSRIGITVLLLFSCFANVGAIRTSLPALFVVCSIVAMAVGATAIVLMWLPSSTRYIHPRASTDA